MHIENILILDDDDDDTALVKGQLLGSNLTIGNISRFRSLEALSRQESYQPLLILASLTLAGTESERIYPALQKTFPYAAVVLLAGTHQQELAKYTVESGAQDYLVKGGFDALALEKTIKYAAERKRSANDFKRLFVNNPAPMYIYDVENFNFLAANKAAALQYGYSEEKFSTMNARDIRPEADLEQFYHVAGEMMDDSYFDAGQWRHKRSNGEIFYVHIYAYLSQFDGRKAVVVMAIDVDKKVRAERRNRELNEEIKKQKEQMDAILSAIPEVVWSRRMDTNAITYINKACERVYGYTPEELIGTKGALFESIHPDDREKLQKAIDNIVVEGAAMCEYRVIHRDGSVRRLFNEAIYNKGEGNAPGIVTGIAIDITEQTRHREQIEKQNEQLREIAWLQSHQVRGPVASILGLAELIDTNDPANTINKEVIPMLLEAVSQLDNSIRQITAKTYDMDEPGQ